MTEAAGIPVGLAVEGANRHDCKLVRSSLESVPPVIEEKRRVQAQAEVQAQALEQGLCMDAVYDSDEVREIAGEFGYTTHIRSRGEEVKAKEAGKKARRWVVERTHRWLNHPTSLVSEMGKESSQSSYSVAFFLRPHHWEQNPIRIGS